MYFCIVWRYRICWSLLLHVFSIKFWWWNLILVFPDVNHSTISMLVNHQILPWPVNLADCSDSQLLK
jgi:hypothetical protein